MKTKSELREIAMTVIYQTYIYDNDYNVDELIKEQIEVQNDYVNDLVKGIIKNQKEIDDLANKYLLNWTIDRLSKVDRAILSIGIYEIMYTDIQCKIAINEAIELSKKYSDEKVTKMINACLDKIYHNEDISDER